MGREADGQKPFRENTKQNMKYKVSKTEHGFEVWDGIAFENPPMAFPTKAEAQQAAKKLSSSPRVADESIGSVLTGRDWN